MLRNSARPLTTCVLLSLLFVLQAIYGFRGANASLLEERFLELYKETTATYCLSDNYRSLSPIVTVGDSIRKQL